MSKAKGMRAGWIGALALAALAGPLQAQQAAQVPGPKSKVAVTVNGEAIALDDVLALLKQDAPPVHPLTKAQEREIYQAALDMLIDDCLKRQFLKKFTLPVSPAEVNKEVLELERALREKKQTLADFYKSSGQTEEQLKAEIVSSLQWQAYVNNQVPEAKLKAYYDENKLFFDKVLVRASHILLRIPEKASDGDKQALRAKLAGIRGDIIAGKLDFAQAAKTYSECPSKASGGDLGQFTYKFAVHEPFAKAAFAMTVGSISDIVETEVGYHLIKVTDRTAGETSNFEEIKDSVRFICAQEMELLPNVIREERKTAHIDYPPQ